MLTNRFKELKVGENESFYSFYSKLYEIVTSKLNFWERNPNKKILRKVLRSLPEVFCPKVATIEENKYIDQIKIQELVGSLQTNVMNIVLNHVSICPLEWNISVPAYFNKLF